MKIIITRVPPAQFHSFISGYPTKAAAQAYQDKHPEYQVYWVRRMQRIYCVRLESK
jgi:hypothetical protein